MFGRSRKNPLEKEGASPMYNEESSYKYGKKSEVTELPAHLFDAPQPLSSILDERKKSDEKSAPLLPHPFQPSMKEEPETTLGEGVVFRGELSFERLLRIDGIFEGELISKGKVIVGPTGRVKANLNLREAIIEGRVEGNISVEEKLELRGEAVVIGNIEAKLFSSDFGVTIKGHVQVTHDENLSPL
jgi:cytoskeletal protein CcmA (bactofilin family)